MTQPNFRQRPPPLSKELIDQIRARITGETPPHPSYVLDKSGRSRQVVSNVPEDPRWLQAVNQQIYQMKQANPVGAPMPADLSHVVAQGLLPEAPRNIALGIREGVRAAKGQKANPLAEELVQSYKQTGEKGFTELPNIGGKPPTEPPVPPAGLPEDEILNNFGKRIASPKTDEEFSAQQALWTQERAKRAQLFSDVLQDELAKGTKSEDAIRIATNQFGGEMPRDLTGLALPLDVRDAAYAKIIRVIQADNEISTPLKSFEIAATTKALDNALSGKPIPNIAGIKGGSARSRLLKIFDSNPVIKDIIEHPEAVQKRLLESAKNFPELDKDTSDYLRNLPTKPFGQERVGAKFTEPTSPTGRPQTRTEVEAFKTELSPRPEGVANKPVFPEEPILRQPQAKLLQDEFKPSSVKPMSEEYAGQRTQELLIDIAKSPDPQSLTPAAATKRFEQFQMLPVTQRMKLLETLRKIGLNSLDVLGIPKSLKFGYDVSYPFRQGAIMGVRHPVAWAKSWKPMVQALKSDKVAEALNRELLADPKIAQAVQKMGLDLYSIERNVSWYKRPETMASKIAEKYIPGVRMSNRGAATFMNKLMTDVAVKNYDILGKMNASEEEYRAMGQLINHLAGRGTLPKWAQGTLGDALNKLFTSPRYVASRFEWPAKLWSPSQIVRREASSSLVAWSSLMATFIGLAQMGGAKFEIDRSSDSMKIVVGDKRLDLWLGYAQIQRALAQLATGKRETASGDLAPISAGQVLGRYFQSKESPGIGALTTLLMGESYIGEKLDLKTMAGIGRFMKETFMPAAIEDMVDAYALEGAGSSVLSGLGLGGVGVSTYAPQVSSSTTPSRSPSSLFPTGKTPATKSKGGLLR